MKSRGFEPQDAPSIPTDTRERDGRPEKDASPE